MRKIIACAAILITAVFLPAGEASAAVSEQGRSYVSVCVCSENNRSSCSCRVTPGGVCLCPEVNSVKECMGMQHHGNSGAETIQQPAGDGTPAPEKTSAGSSGSSDNSKQNSPAKTKKNNKTSTNNSGHGNHNSKTGTNNSGHGNHNNNSKHGGKH